MEYMDGMQVELVRQWSCWPTARVFVVRDECGAIVGAAFVNDTTKASNACNIDLIFVRPDARRKGFGSRLMTRIIAMPCKHIFAIPDSEESEAFLATHGLGSASSQHIIPFGKAYKSAACCHDASGNQCNENMHQVLPKFVAPMIPLFRGDRWIRDQTDAEQGDNKTARWQ